MLVKINKKPITVSEDTNKEKDFDSVYFSVSCVGYGLILLLMDYVCYTFFGVYAFPLLHYVWRLFL